MASAVLPSTFLLSLSFLLTMPSAIPSLYTLLLLRFLHFLHSILCYSYAFCLSFLPHPSRAMLSNYFLAYPPHLHPSVSCFCDALHSISLPSLPSKYSFLFSFSFTFKFLLYLLCLYLTPSAVLHTIPSTCKSLFIPSFYIMLLLCLIGPSFHTMLLLNLLLSFLRLIALSMLTLLPFLQLPHLFFCYTFYLLSFQILIYLLPFFFKTLCPCNTFYISVFQPRSLFTFYINAHD